MTYASIINLNMKALADRRRRRRKKLEKRGKREK
jgi:hypothetical protein